MFGIRFDAQQAIESLDAQDIKDSAKECEVFSEFIRQAWHIIEPGSEYIHGWHIDFIAEHLMAITNNEVLDDGSLYNRLMIAIPPGMMKSLTVNVFFLPSSGARAICRTCVTSVSRTAKSWRYATASRCAGSSNQIGIDPGGRMFNYRKIKIRNRNLKTHRWAFANVAPSTQ